MVDPEVGAQIYPGSSGRTSASPNRGGADFDERNAGLEMLTERGILCKVNSVMIPGSTTSIWSRSTAR